MRLPPVSSPQEGPHLWITQQTGDTWVPRRASYSALRGTVPGDWRISREPAQRSALTYALLIKGFDEAHVPAKQRQEGQTAWIPSSHVHSCRPCRVEGPSSPWAGASLSLTGHPGRVHGRTVFTALAASRRQARSGPVTVHFLPPGDDRNEVLVAYAIGRHVGGAVVRNRWRRRLRAIAAEISPELAHGAYLVGLGRGAVDLRFDELRGRVIETMRRASGEPR